MLCFYRVIPQDTHFIFADFSNDSNRNGWRRGGFVVEQWEAKRYNQENRNMNLTDVHTHLHVCSQYPNLSVIAKLLLDAKERGIERVVVVSENLEQAKEILSMSQHKNEVFRMILPSAGLHPIQNGRSVSNVNQLDEIVSWIRDNYTQLKCIGEIGLDFTPAFLGSDASLHEGLKQVQIDVFTKQLELAKELSLPVNIHSRSAGHYVLEVLEKVWFVQDADSAAICHAFDGKAHYALQSWEKHKGRLFFSIPASVCRSPQTQKLVERLPLEALLLETDSPALSPSNQKDPTGGKEVNCPANLLVSLEWIAKIKGVSETDAASTIAKNVVRVF